MAGSEPARRRGHPLRDRLLVGAVLLVVAVGAILLGGSAFALLAGAAGLLVWREWAALEGVGRPLQRLGLVLIAGAVVLAVAGRPIAALLLLGAGAAGIAAGARSLWAGAGISYAGLAPVGLVWMRAEPGGTMLVAWTMALVWATDIFAFFAGRTIGGPKIWPAVSPSKTWAGLVGGMAAAAAASAVIAGQAGWPQPAWQMALMGAGLAVVAQAGDFFESALKRDAGVKDSGTLLPGHGGAMDRVDGLIPVAILVALWVAAR
jgi:phosphatidate cytidylyltransferase